MGEKPTALERASGVAAAVAVLCPPEHERTPPPLSSQNKNEQRTAGRLGLVHERERVLDVLEDVACLSWLGNGWRAGKMSFGDKKFKETEKKNFISFLSPSGPTNERSTLPFAAFFWLMDPPNMIQVASEVAETSLSLILMRGSVSSAIVFFLNCPFAAAL